VRPARPAGALDGGGGLGGSAGAHHTVVATVSVCAYLIGRTEMVIDAGGAALFPQTAGNFAIRNVWIGWW